MIEISKSLVIRWEAIEGRNEKFAPCHIDLNCTNNDCRRSLVNSVLKWNDLLDFAHTRFNCAACGEQLRLFLIDTPASLQPEQIEKSRILVFPPQTVRIDFSQELMDLSPQFVKVYKQACESEFLNLDELAGMGYRKALEFVIKNFAISVHPTQEAEIKIKLLAQCIRDYINDQNIKSCAERAAWLGNDETHYIRKWKNYDLDDLKILLRLTVNFIENDLLAKKFTAAMRVP